MTGLGACPGFAVGERDVSSRRGMIWQADVEPCLSERDWFVCVR